MRTIPNFPDYKINTKGQVWSTYTNKYLAPVRKNGYLRYSLQKNGNQYNRYAQRLMHSAYKEIINPENLPIGMHVVDHINGYRDDNRLDNLTVCTQAENIARRADQEYAKRKASSPEEATRMMRIKLGLD